MKLKFLVVWVPIGTDFVDREAAWKYWRAFNPAIEAPALNIKFAAALEALSRDWLLLYFIEFYTFESIVKAVASNPVDLDILEPKRKGDTRFASIRKEARTHFLQLLSDGALGVALKKLLTKYVLKNNLCEHNLSAVTRSMTWVNLICGRFYSPVMC